jgi:adenylate cyclase
MIRALEAHDQVYSIYVGYGSGDFLEVIAPRGNPDILSIHKAPGDTRFIVRAITRDSDGQREETWRFLNQDRQVVGARTEPDPSYDPRNRPWYNLGLTAESHAFTDPYLFSSLRKPGITVIRRIMGGGGVVGIDITLSGLSLFLKEQNVSSHGVVFLLDDQGHLLAHPQENLVVTTVASTEESETTTKVGLSRANESRNPIVRAVGVMLKEEAAYGGTKRILDIEGEKTLVHITGLADGGQTFVAIAAPTADFTKPIERMQLNNLIFSALALIMVVPLIVLVSRRIARTLGQLAREADRIRRFELEAPVTVDSIILEIHTLARSFELMKDGLRNFGRYVPRDLVKQIVLSGVTPVLGGRRQELTIMFTDVKEFTIMSEQLSPEDLMQRTSKYFEALGNIIAECGGVVDKYIGDAIMAFWNAPHPDPDHVANACVAILKCRATNEAFNAELRAKAFPEFHTRFGLHCGEAVVGNVGSSDRMNYTAIGAPVNIASRIEGLNKFYGTQILVSGAIRDRARSGFLMRPIDLVVAKGAKTPVEIHELVAALPGNEKVPRSMWANEETIALCEPWEEAYRKYRERDWGSARSAFEAIQARFPKDQLTRIFIERCRNFELNPPEPTWNGVLEITEK